MVNILSGIVESKKKEIEALYRDNNPADLLKKASDLPNLDTPAFYQRLASFRQDAKPFFITEFKRKSPSEGWIAENADVQEQVLAYARAGAGAISVLTDTPFFGGKYKDLQDASETLAFHYLDKALERPLLLQKDFILDRIQIYLAKIHGADIILLIAAILSPETLDSLRTTAESLGMGVLVEVHDEEELHGIDHLPFKVLGVNNRDLRTFRTALNRVNVFKLWNNQRFLVSESSILDYRHFQMVRKADAFLIGTGLMRSNWSADSRFTTHFKSNGQKLFKACGLRKRQDIEQVLEKNAQQPDFIGINFSPLSKRSIQTEELDQINNPLFWNKAVAVFYKNSETEILTTLAKYPFKTIQLYAGDQSPAFIQTLKQRILLAVRMTESWADDIRPYALQVDCFILDGSTPGSGQQITMPIPQGFPYPFLLAGGIHEHNLLLAQQHDSCIGVDIASGIESDGHLDLEKIQRISRTLHLES